MYEIKQKNKVLPDGHEIQTFTRGIEYFNILEVEAGTNGHMGGDTGHGGRTYFRISDVYDTDIEVRVLRDGCKCAGFEVFLGGDSELDTIITALKFITKALEDKAKGVYD